MEGGVRSGGLGVKVGVGSREVNGGRLSGPGKIAF